jgi:hypothetical protein
LITSQVTINLKQQIPRFNWMLAILLLLGFCQFASFKSAVGSLQFIENSVHTNLLLKAFAKFPCRAKRTNSQCAQTQTVKSKFYFVYNPLVGAGNQRAAARRFLTRP